MNERMLILLLRQKLAAQGCWLLTCRPATKSFKKLGRYYSVHQRTHRVHRTHIDLTEYGRETGVLKPDETVEPE